MTDENYGEILDKTISEVKEEVEENEKINLEKLLEAEIEGKDRKTLKEWIENKIEDREVELEDETVSGEELNTWERPFVNILLGILIGFALTFIVMYPAEMVEAEEFTLDEIDEMVTDYIVQQMGDVDEDINITVTSIDQDTYEDIFVVTMLLEDEQATQEFNVYVSKRSGLMFMGGLAGIDPIDLERGEIIGMME